MTKRSVVSNLCPFGLLAALTACAAGGTATSPPAPAAEETKPAPKRLTATEINEQCWMKYETNKAGGDLDKRMKLVDVCVATKTKEQTGM